MPQGSHVMEIRNFLTELRARQIEVNYAGDELEVFFEEEELEDEILLQIRENKEAIIAYLRQLQEADVTAVAPIGRAPLSEGYVLSSSQRRLWILSQFEGGSSAYHLGGAYTFRGDLDAAALGRALQTLSLRHESLRTTFAAGPEGVPLQYIHSTHSAAAPTLRQHDLRDASDPEAAARVAVAANAEAPFDLEQGPLLRVVLLQLPEDTWVLGYALHHLISDGWSMQIMLRELLELYNAYASGAGEDEALTLLPMLPIQYKDYAYWQQEQLRSGTLAGERAYWLNRFKGEVPVLELPQDGVRPAVRRYKGAVMHRQWSSLGSFTALVQQSGATLFMGLLAVVEAVLYRYSGQEDLIVGTPIAGRNHADVQGGIGFYVNTLALRTRVEGSKNFKTLLAEVRLACLEGYEHQGYPFDELVEELGLRRDTGRHPLFDVMVVLQNLPAQSRNNESKGMEDVSVDTYELNPDQVSKFDLLFTFTEIGEGVSLLLEYDSALYEEARMERLCTHLEGMLQAVITHPDEAVDQLHYFSSEERHQLLDGFNPTYTDYPKDATLVSLFEQSVEAHPEAIALVHEEEQITYTQLNERANAVAHYLIEAGIQSDELVGLCLERGVTLIAALLGVLKAGAGYVPIDPEYPQERIQYMIQDSGCRIVLDEEKLNAIHKASHQHTNPNLTIQPHHAAYVIYTSGTTGQPKGVLIEHRNVVRLFFTDQPLFDFTSADVWTFFHSVCFDFSVWEIYGALLFGGRLVIVPSLTAKDPARFLHLLQQESVTVLNQTPSAFYNLIAEDSQHTPAPLALRYVIFGGEALAPARLARWQQRYPAAKLVNMYGITETTVHVTYKEIGEAEIIAGTSTIGIPIPTLTCYVLDAHRQLLPIGIPGELYVGGAGLARCYLNKPALTAERFVDHPFKKGERLYRSGDEVVRLADGSMEYIGRLDDQVKIRGYRIELGEIETTLRAMHSISSAVVLPTTDPEGERSLAAFFVADTPLDAGDIRSHLSGHLPAYMLPSYYRQLDEMPLTSNGKIEKKKLLSLELATVAGPAHTPPQNETERKLQTIWKEVLRTDTIGVTDNFFAFGGDSIKAIKVVVRIRKELDASVSVNRIYELPTIRGLAATLSAHIGEDPTLRQLKTGLTIIEGIREAVVREDTGHNLLPPVYEDIYPFTAVETGMIYSSLSRQNEPVYYDQFIFSIRIDDQQAFERSFEGLVQRHANLRTKYFLNSFRHPVKVIVPHIDLPIRWIDLAHLEAPERQAAIIAYRNEDLETRLTFNDELLWHLAIFRTGKSSYFLVVSMHHALADGWSVSILASELMAKPGASVTPLRHSYKDYCAIELARQRSAETGQYWKQLLQGYTRNKLPFNHKGNPIRADKGMKKMTRYVRKNIMEGLQQLCLEERISFKAACLAAHALLMHVLCAEKEVVTGVVTHDRPQLEDSEKIIGCFLNTIPLRVNVSELSTFRDLLQYCEHFLMQVKPHEIHLAEIGSILGEQASARNPFFDSLMNFTDFVSYDRPVGAEAVTESETIVEVTDSGEMTNTLFDLEVDKTHDLLSFRIKYVPAYFSEEDIETAIELYERILEQLFLGTGQKLSAMELLDATQKEELVYRFNATDTPYNVEKSLHQLFEEQADLTPGLPALIQDGETISYGELEARANALANCLIDKGVSPGCNVGLVSARNFDMIIGMLAILKAGGAYVPVDPEYPVDRQSYILSNSGVRLVLADQPYDFLHELPGGQAVLTASGKDYSDRRPEVRISSTSLAYTIYTSGSTGRPKGVMIEHHSAVNLVEWVNKRFATGPHDRLLFITSMCFDLSVYDIFGMLACGGGIVIVRQEEVMDMDRLPELLREHRITFWDSVPTTMNYLIGELESAPMAFLQEQLRVVFMSGDWIPVSLPNRLRNFFPSAEVISLGGATEGTVWSNYFPVGDVPSAWTSIPYGRPIDNNYFYILDDHLRPVPKGVTGELFIGGVGVSRGYANDPAKTAYAFLPDPFSRRPAAMMYRTGDLGRMLPDGNMEFLGRKDFQVKIRGFRVELGEIESVLAKYDFVQENVVAAIDDATGNKQLAAYIVSSREIDIPSIVAYLKSSLPLYMVPTYYFQLEKIPLNSNGKIDRKQLPLPEESAAGSAYVAPTNAVEEQLTLIWEEILGREQIGIHDSFFELGGDSFRIMKLHKRVSAAFPGKMSIVDFFDHTTIAQISKFIGSTGEPAGVESFDV